MLDPQQLSILSGLLAAAMTGLWRAYVYRDQKKTRLAEELRVAKNDELAAQRKADARAIRRLRKRCHDAEVKLKECIDRQATP